MKNWYQKLTTLAFWYAGLSVIIGPAISFYGDSKSPGPSDCYDPSWGNTPISKRIDYLWHSQMIEKHLAEVMLAIGLVILV